MLRKKKWFNMTPPIYGCPNCGKKLKAFEADGRDYYKCKSCNEEFDADYIESPFGGSVVLQYGTPMEEDDDENEPDEPYIW
jgi:transposase-like protein